MRITRPSCLSGEVISLSRYLSCNGAGVYVLLKNVCTPPARGGNSLAEQTRAQFDDAIGAAGYFDFNGNWVRFYL
jgi:hypothetical protein